MTGLAIGETLLAIDFRPLNGQLFGLGSGSNLYTINTVNGLAVVPEPTSVLLLGCAALTLLRCKRTS